MCLRRPWEAVSVLGETQGTVPDESGMRYHFTTTSGLLSSLTYDMLWFGGRFASPNRTIGPLSGAHMAQDACLVPLKRAASDPNAPTSGMAAHEYGRPTRLKDRDGIARSPDDG